MEEITMISTNKANKIVNNKRMALIKAGKKEKHMPSIYTLFSSNPELMHKNIGRIRAIRAGINTGKRKPPFGVKIHKAMLLYLGSKNAVDKIYMDKACLGSFVTYDTIKTSSFKQYGENLPKIKASIFKQYIETINNEVHLNGFDDTKHVMKFNVFDWYRDAWDATVNKYTEK
jgi:hypothetical protein